MASLRVEKVGEIHAVEPTAWDELAAGRSLFVSRPWLEVVERDTRAAPCYVLCRNGAELVAALPLYDVAEESNAFYRAAEELAGLRGIPAGYLVGGARRGYRNDLLVRPGAPRRQALARLAEAALAEGRAVVFFFLSSADAEALAALDGASTPLLQRLDASLELPGASFADYLRSLPRDRRRKVRREVELFAASGLDVGVEPVGDVVEEAAPLLVNVARKYGGDLPLEEMHTFLSGLHDAFGARCILFTGRLDGKLVGYSLTVEWGDRLYIRAIGFDYDALPRAAAYFNLGYYVPIRHGYERGLAGVHLGLESYQPKVFRGARLEPLWAVVLRGDGSGPSPADAHEWNERRREELRRRLEAEGIGRATAGLRLPGGP